MIVHSLEYYTAVQKDMAVLYILWTGLLNKIENNVQRRMKAVSELMYPCVCFVYGNRSIHKCTKYGLLSVVASGESN